MKLSLSKGNKQKQKGEEKSWNKKETEIRLKEIWREKKTEEKIENKMKRNEDRKEKTEKKEWREKTKN